jgi:polyhydroxyalkanoate synthesis regulator phasin
MSIKVNNHYYRFIMNTDIPFGKGRYTKSSLGNLTDAGWYSPIENDRDVSLLVGMLANSRADIEPLIEQFDENPEDFEELKKDLTKSDLSRIVAIHLGWRDFDNLTDYIYDELDDMVDSGDISREEADNIVDNLTDEDVYKIAEDIYALSEKEIISGIKSSKNLKDLFKFLKKDVFSIIWENAVEIVDYHIREKLSS